MRGHELRGEGHDETFPISPQIMKQPILTGWNKYQNHGGWNTAREGIFKVGQPGIRTFADIPPAPLCNLDRRQVRTFLRRRSAIWIDDR